MMLMLVCATFFLLSSAQVVRSAFPENSPHFQFAPAKKDVQVKELQGLWWIYRTIDNFELGPVSCPVLRFYATIDGMTVMEDYIKDEENPPEHSRVTWTLQQNKYSKEVGNMVSEKFSPDFGLVEQSFDIIDTDYKTYLYVNTWKSHPLTLAPSQRQGGVVFTKRKAMTSQELRNIENQVTKAMTDNQIESFYYSNVDNTLCREVFFPLSVERQLEKSYAFFYMA